MNNINDIINDINGIIEQLCHKSTAFLLLPSMSFVWIIKGNIKPA